MSCSWSINTHLFEFKRKKASPENILFIEPPRDWLKLFSHSDAFILCFDLRNPDKSLNWALKWFDDNVKEVPGKILPPILFVGLHADQASEELIRKYRHLPNFLIFSNKERNNGKGAGRLKKRIAKLIIRQRERSSD